MRGEANLERVQVHLQYKIIKIIIRMTSRNQLNLFFSTEELMEKKAHLIVCKWCQADVTFKIHKTQSNSTLIMVLVSIRTNKEELSLIYEAFSFWKQCFSMNHILLWRMRTNWAWNVPAKLNIYQGQHGWDQHTLITRICLMNKVP